MPLFIGVFALQIKFIRVWFVLLVFIMLLNVTRYFIKTSFAIRIFEGDA